MKPVLALKEKSHIIGKAIRKGHFGSFFSNNWQVIWHYRNTSLVQKNIHIKYCQTELYCINNF